MVASWVVCSLDLFVRRKRVVILLQGEGLLAALMCDRSGAGRVRARNIGLGPPLR